MDFDATGQLLIVYSSFVIYFSKNGNKNEAAHQLRQRVYDSFRMAVLYITVVEFGIPMKLVKLIKVCLNETCSIVLVGKYLPDIFPIKNDLK